MKTIPLAEAIQKATKGPVKAFHNGFYHDVVCGESQYDPCVASVWAANGSESANAALLAHWFNHGPELVKALREQLEAEQKADKQWIGLNMNDPNQKRAYEIIQAARIRSAEMLARVEKVEIS